RFTHVRVRRHGLKQLFLSTRFSPMWISGYVPDLIKEMHSLAAEYGFELVTGNKHERITPQVMRLMQSSEATLQVIPLLPHERGPADAKLTWMVTEYAIALMKEIPTKRIFDIGRPGINIDTWIQELQVDPELPVLTFQTFRELMDQRLPEALGELRDLVDASS
ncbi:MAG: hypothetical protein AAGB34_08265, partial [Planctomycetota bacterium]